jgi:hypothetical protein
LLTITLFFSIKLPRGENEDATINIDLNNIKGISRILLFREIIHLVVAADKYLFVDYLLGDKHFRCEHRFTKLQKGNFYLFDIGRYTEDGKYPPVRKELARISDAIGSNPSQKIAEAMRTSRTNGQPIENVRCEKDGDGQITTKGI